jgi:SAM-dependent methyltransferase
MPKGWEWDETLFQGAAAHYVRGRPPYPKGLADALATALALDGRGRLLDVGCGPGTVALRVAHLFEQAVGLDPDREMLAEAKRLASEQGVTNARWVQARAEELPLGLGTFRVATFAQSFHWMDREQVAATVRTMLAPGGAFVLVNIDLPSNRTAAPVGPYPDRPQEAVAALVRAYLGPVRRAGQGVLLYGTPTGEADVLAGAGFAEPQYIFVPAGELGTRSIDDLVAATLSNSASAPHLFGDRLADFEADLRRLLGALSPAGLFSERVPDAELQIWRNLG